MKKFKVTINSDLPRIQKLIDNNELEFELNHDPGFECLNQIAGDTVISHLLDIFKIDWDIEEVK